MTRIRPYPGFRGRQGRGERLGPACTSRHVASNCARVPCGGDRLRMVVDEIIRLLNHVKENRKVLHPTRQRWLAAGWGSGVFHLALWTYAEADPEINVATVGGLLFRDTVAIVLPAYSAVFGAIVAYGIPNGSLIRHFVYGALLPAVAYGLAGTLIDPGTDIGSQE